MKTEWTNYTSACAIACAITSTMRGERTELVRRFDSSEEADRHIKTTYGFVVRDFTRAPHMFPATRAVVDLVAYAAQDMRIPHEFYENFLKNNVKAGPFNPFRKVDCYKQAEVFLVWVHERTDYIVKNGLKEKFIGAVGSSLELESPTEKVIPRLCRQFGFILPEGAGEEYTRLLQDRVSKG